MARRSGEDVVLSQRALAELLGVHEQTVSRAVRAARRRGVPLPPQRPLPGSSRQGWVAGPFVAWWKTQRPQG